MENDLNYWAKWKATIDFQQNGRRSEYFYLKEKDLNLRQMKDDLNFKENGRLPLIEATLPAGQFRCQDCHWVKFEEYSAVD